MTANALFASDALLPTGWAQNVLLRWNDSGTLTEVQNSATCPAGTAQACGPLIPGIPNLHSHAFQRGFAGLSEYRAEQQDSFWSWRKLMYQFAARLSPEDLEALATWLYVEMLEAGYTSVCEFQYLHHAPGGQPYAPPSAMSEALLRAAARAGIGITLLPVLYQHSGFGSLPANKGQARFIHSTEAMLRLLQHLLPLCQAQGAQLGLAPHSLRAVSPQSLAEAVAGLHGFHAQAPIHIHIAEQTKEVDDCIAWSDQRPVQWLMGHAPVDARWCLIHATHMTDDEYRSAAQSQAVAGLCPTTEANLGDGIFDLPRWQAHGGRWGIGSDSHIAVNAAEELLMLEYSQRLATRSRNVGTAPGQPHVGTALQLQAVAGGAQASGRAIGGLAVGQQADLVSLNASHIALQGLTPQQMLDAHVFASSRTSAVASVWVGGKQQVQQASHGQQARHALHAEAAAQFTRTRQKLLA